MGWIFVVTISVIAAVLVGLKTKLIIVPAVIWSLAVALLPLLYFYFIEDYVDNFTYLGSFFAFIIALPSYLAAAGVMRLIRRNK